MKTVLKIATFVALLASLQGCAVLGALGIGAKDLAPSLSYCHEVSYQRFGVDIDLKAKCRVPVN